MHFFPVYVVTGQAHHSRKLSGYGSSRFSGQAVLGGSSDLSADNAGSGETKLDVRFQDETVWLTQKLMADLFQTTSQNITIHLKNLDNGQHSIVTDLGSKIKVELFLNY